MNLLPYPVYKELGLGELKLTDITLCLADRTMKYPKGIVENVIVKVNEYYYHIDFVVLEIEPAKISACDFRSSIPCHFRCSNKVLKWSDDFSL